MKDDKVPTTEVDQPEDKDDVDKDIEQAKQAAEEEEEEEEKRRKVKEEEEEEQEKKRKAAAEEEEKKKKQEDAGKGNNDDAKPALDIKIDVPAGGGVVADPTKGSTTSNTATTNITNTVSKKTLNQTMEELQAVYKDPCSCVKSMMFMFLTLSPYMSISTTIPHYPLLSLSSLPTTSLFLPLHYTVSVSSFCFLPQPD